MKILHIATASGGGAGIAARRSVEALWRTEQTAEFLAVDGDLRSHEAQIWRRRLDWLPHRVGYPRRKFFSVWSNNWQPSRLAPEVNARGADIVNLHWLGDGSLHWKELSRVTAPVVWTLHDAWAFTGGCHYPNQCTRYHEACGACPQLGSSEAHDLSWRNLRRKKLYADDVARWTTPSEWLARLAADSGTVPRGLLRVIPYGLNGDVYRRRRVSRTHFLGNIPEDALVLATGAVDLAEIRKGVSILPEMILRLRARIKRKCVMILFGAAPLQISDWPEGTHWTGPLKTSEEVADMLSIADVFVLPSLQDNLPNVVLEALACGCPSVGFDSGGFSEMVETGVTGWIAEKKDAEGLADAVHRWLQVAPSREEVAGRCRARFEDRYTLERHARALTALYEEVLDERRTA